MIKRDFVDTYYIILLCIKEVLLKNVYWVYWKNTFCLLFASTKGSDLGPATIFGSWKPFKNDKKCFLFHLEISFLSQDI